MAANTEDGFFRLIFLSPGQWNDEIHCTLIPFNRLRNGYPPYKALSYVWGRGSRNPPEIVVNGNNVKVTSNLAMALRHLRQDEVGNALWIDALCIDQSNTDERSSQVAQMRDIYATAVEVIVFLGSGLQHGMSKSLSSRDSRPFHRFGGCEPDSLLANQYFENWKGSPLKKPVQPLEVFAFLTIMNCAGKLPDPLGALKDIPEAHMTALAEALRRTLLAPWWDRIWVVQEAVVASRLTVRYGNVAVPWELLVGAAEVLSDWESFHATYPSSLSVADLKVFSLSSRILHLNNFRTQWSHSRGTNLLLLLRYFGFRRASDERDRVYALLGLCNEATLLRPDYRLQLAEVYMAPVLMDIRETKSLHVLNGDHSRKGRQDAPSWVPDWSTERDEIERRRIELSTLYDACKGIRVLLMTKTNRSAPELIRDDIASLLDRLKAEHEPKCLLREEYAPLLRDPRASIFHSPSVGREIKRICGELARYCHEGGLRELPKYSMMIYSRQSLRTVGRKIGIVSRTLEPLYEPLHANSAAEVLGEWVKVARAMPVEYIHDNFLRTIFSDMKKVPDGSMKRLLPGDMNSSQGGLVSGGDPAETLTPLFQDNDRFAEALRLSTTKRAMFFINDVDGFYRAMMEALDKQEILLGESEKLFDQYVERAAHMKVLHQHMKLISESRLLIHNSRFLRPLKYIERADLVLFFDDATRLLDGRLIQFDQGQSIPENEGIRHAPVAGEHTQLEFHDKKKFRDAQYCMIDEHRSLLRRQRQLLIKLTNKLINLPRDRSFFTKYGHMGMGPMLMKEGDEVYIMPGSRVPLVLRPESCCRTRACSHSTQRYQLIGDCFVHGVMDGELSLDGFDILTIDDLSDDKQSWKEFNDECGMRASEGNHDPVDIGSLVALEIV
ncbi:heterokaryon incompatibility protein domain-containing protein [Trichoderma aethiopicum]